MIVIQHRSSVIVTWRAGRKAIRREGTDQSMLR
jgi:hypothetical protein